MKSLTSIFGNVSFINKVSPLEGAVVCNNKHFINEKLKQLTERLERGPSEQMSVDKMG